jgi:hypothetical protein
LIVENLIHFKFSNCKFRESLLVNKLFILGSVISGVIVAIKKFLFTFFQASQFNSVTFQTIEETFFSELFQIIFHSKIFDSEIFHPTINESYFIGIWLDFSSILSSVQQEAKTKVKITNNSLYRFINLIFICFYLIYDNSIY